MIGISKFALFCNTFTFKVVVLLQKFFFWRHRCRLTFNSSNNSKGYTDSVLIKNARPHLTEMYRWLFLLGWSLLWLFATPVTLKAICLNSFSTIKRCAYHTFTTIKWGWSNEVVGTTVSSFRSQTCHHLRRPHRQPVIWLYRSFLNPLAWTQTGPCRVKGKRGQSWCTPSARKEMVSLSLT